MGTYGDLYAEGRERFIDVVRDADPSAPVPTCPAWTVKDVLAHAAGIPADILAGRLDGVATDPWTAAQVDARRDRTIAEVVDEWRETGPQIDAIIDSFGPTGAQLLFDLTTHELDVRTALGISHPEDLAVYDVALDFMAGFLATSPVRFVVGDQAWGAAEDDAAATLTTTKRELLRCLSGRRTPSQIAALSWSGDPTPHIDLFAFGPFSFPTADIAE
jgi:uncharacterized protein (TIGR03083 family)